MARIFSATVYACIGVVILSTLLISFQSLFGQERAVLLSAGKIKGSTKFLVCIKTESGRIISLKYNSHCWRCKTVALPMKWDVLRTRKKTFVKPVL